MQKSDEYEEIHNNYVQCEQVSLPSFYFITKFVFVCCRLFNNSNDVKQWCGLQSSSQLLVFQKNLEPFPAWTPRHGNAVTRSCSEAAVF